MPDRYFAQPIAKMVREDKETWGDFMQKVKYDFASELGAHTSALLSYYPPGGFVGWHTNYDANAYQVLFTWSETGEGFFEYYDKQKDEIIKIDDVPGSTVSSLLLWCRTRRRSALLARCIYRMSTYHPRI